MSGLWGRNNGRLSHFNQHILRGRCRLGTFCPSPGSTFPPHLQRCEVTEDDRVHLLWQLVRDDGLGAPQHEAP